MAELLLELLSEEIPARMQARAADDLKRLVTAALKDAGLEFQSAEAYVTPRRLALVVDGLPVDRPRKEGEKRGPRSDASLPALQGFARSVGLPPQIVPYFENLKPGETFEPIDNDPLNIRIEVRSSDRGDYFYAVVTQPSMLTVEALKEILSESLVKFQWPKSMRWGAEEPTSDALLAEDRPPLLTEDGGKILLDIAPPRWVRPIHSILCLFAGDVVPIAFAGAEAKDTTRGHRFMAPEPITVADFADYKAKLKKAKVVLDGAERAQMIKAGAERLAAAEGLKLRDDPALLVEVAGLVEWPVALMGSIDKAFMDLPDEVLTTSMRHHQKYFALTEAKGKLAPKFIVVANTEALDKGESIVAGNERVLRARLADAKFFWDQDRKVKLESRVAKLAEVVFHARLGTMAEKAGRMEALAAGLCEYVPDADEEPARTAARLSKADLVTTMVGEFPELQGVMGRFYALGDGVGEDIALAIAEHYAPLGPADECPTAPLSVTVALADKIDTLVGLFAIGEKPTGSRDPFALRRAALGVIRIVTENGLRVPLGTIHFHAYRTLNQQGYGRDYSDRIMKERFGRVGVVPQKAYQMPELVAFFHEEFLGFFAERLKVRMREKGVRHDLIAAAFAVDKPGGGLEDDLVRLLARVEALTAFLETDDGADLLTAYKRAANIVAIEEKKDKQSYDGEADPKLFAQDEETALHASLGASMKASSMALEEEDFTAVMGELAKLRAPVDAFFDEVTVNCDDPKLRENRLRLLSQIRATLGNVADFSRIEG